MHGLADGLKPGQDVVVEAVTEEGTTRSFLTTVRIDAPAEAEYFARGGLLRMVLGDLLAGVGGPG